MQITIDIRDAAAMCRRAAEHALYQVGEWNDEDNFVIAANEWTDNVWAAAIEESTSVGLHDMLSSVSDLLLKVPEDL